MGSIKDWLLSKFTASTSRAIHYLGLGGCPAQPRSPYFFSHAVDGTRNLRLVSNNDQTTNVADVNMRVSVKRIIHQAEHGSACASGFFRNDVCISKEVW